MTKPKIFLADLTHTAMGISSLTFPLGTAFVASYADAQLGGEYEFKLFKYPKETAEAILDETPKIVAFSNYSWNFEIGYRMAKWAKEKNPDVITVFGGPNFPVTDEEREAFLKSRPAIDFYIQNEGEVGFVELVNQLSQHGFQRDRLHKSGVEITNCCYMSDGRLIAGKIERILDVNTIPSPYLNGMLDKFFDEPLSPMVETTRGCPFACAYCADGLASKNRVVRFDHQRVRDEMYYIVERVKNVDELNITDLNFGMYKTDIETAELIAEVQKKYDWPVVIGASAGKNQPKRILKAAAILKGSWLIGSAVQSTDEEVLKNVQRDNISTQAYHDFIEFVNKQSKDAQSYTEIILGLPGDSKEKHFNSLRSGVENHVSTFRMYQAIMLMGTAMASEATRKKFEMQTKYRIVPGCIGSYQFGDDEISVAEIEEIVVGGKDMTFDDYVSCRVMNLLVETYINNGLFEEMFAVVEAMGVQPFDIMVHLHSNQHLFSEKMVEIIDSFIVETKDDLYESHAEAESFVLQKINIQKFLSGELGGNELLEHRARLYFELDDIADVFTTAVKQVLDKAGLLDDDVAFYFDELKEFIVCRKSNIHKTDDNIEHSFAFDFMELDEAGFSVDPRGARALSNGIRMNFFHTPEQKKHIDNAVALYANHSGGISRMIQRNNLKMMYRSIEYA